MVVCIRRISHGYISTPNEGVVVWFRFASLPWPTHSQQIQKSQIRIQPFHVQHIPLDLFPTSIDKDAPAAFAALFATVEIRDEPPPPPSRISSDAPQSGPHPRQSMASITYQSCINHSLLLMSELVGLRPRFIFVWLYFVWFIFVRFIFVSYPTTISPHIDFFTLTIKTFLTFPKFPN